MKHLLTLILIGLSLRSDFMEAKIKNKVLIMFAAAAVCLASSSRGYAGIYNMLCGLLVPLVTLYPLFVIGCLGAGDIKLLCTLGAFWGPSAGFIITAGSLILGGLQSMFILMRMGLLKSFCINSLNCFINAFTNSGSVQINSLLLQQGGIRFRFTGAISIAAMITIILHY